jgi:hypothetical protein
LFLDKGKGGEKKMRKRITLLIAALMMALSMSVSGVAFGAITKENGGGNQPGGEAKGIPAKNPADKCPPGKNKNLSPGGQKKC